MTSLTGIINFISSSIQFSFDVANEEAIKYFESKGLKSTFHYTEMMREDHNKAVTVAKMMDMDMLQDVHDSITLALKKGWTFEEWSDRIVPIMQANGWWGRQQMTDPRTGQTILADLGSPHRLKTIFRTNIQQAYMVGRWQQIMATSKARPYLRYDAIDDHRTRPKHKKWNGIILPFNHRFWRKHMPLNGYNCRCSVTQFSKEDLEAKGYKVTENPDLSTDGIDVGFDYNAGLSHWNYLQDIASQKASTIKDQKMREAAQSAISTIQSQVKNVELPKLEILDNELSNKQFKQPPSETFGAYDAGAPSIKPDISTPLRQAVIEMEDKIRKDDLETGIAFNENGQLLFKKQGLPDRVELTDDELQLLNGVTFTHNHPGGMPFSIADIRMAISYNMKEIRVVTPLLRYSMSPKLEWGGVIALIATINEIRAQANKEVIEKVRLGEIHPQFAEAEYLHYIWMMVADRLNLNYRRERS